MAIRFVATAGNINNSGLSELLPWPTAAKVNASVLAPGDVILFKGSDSFPETITCPNSGVALNPIIFGSYGTGQASFPGSDAITSWSGAGPTYTSSVTTSPNQVFKNNVRLVKGASAGALNDQEWFWVGGVLSFRNDAGAPTLITTSSRDNGFNCNGKSHLVIQDLNFQEHNLRNIAFAGASHDDIVIQRCTAERAFLLGIASTTGNVTTNVTVQSCNVGWCGATGIEVHKDSSPWTIRYNVVYNCSQLCDVSYPNDVLKYSGGIRCWSDNNTITGVLIDHNIVRDIGKLPSGSYVAFAATGGAGGVGIWMDTVKLACIISNNIVSGCQTDGIRIEYSWDQLVIRCIIYGTVAEAGGLGPGAAITAFSGADTVKRNKFYHLTVYGNAQGIAVFGRGSSIIPDNCIDNEVVNCVSFGNATRQIDARFGGENDGVNGHGNIYQKNCLGPDTGTPVMWGNGVFKSYTNWDAADVPHNSIKADPLFVDAVSHDFNLQSGSPCINAGQALPGYNDGRTDLGAIERESSTTLIRVGNKRITGFSQIFLNGSITPHGTVNAINLSGNPSPAGYDPTRLGSDLIVGRNWANLNIGLDGGRQALIDEGGFFVNANPQNFPPIGASVEISTIFGKVVQFPQYVKQSHPEIVGQSYAPSVSNRFDFPMYGSQPGEQIWIRSHSRWMPGASNIILGVPTFSARNTDLNGVSCGTPAQGNGSAAWKLWFLWQQGTNAAGVRTGANSASRQENVLTNSDRHALSAGQIGSQGGTQTQITNTSASVVRQTAQKGAPNKPIGLASEGLAGLTGAGEMFYNGLLTGRCTNGEWYEDVHAHIVTSPTTFVNLHASRKISTGGGTVLDLSSNYAWVSWDCTCNPLYLIILGYIGYQLGGNKSSQNCMADPQFHQWGPFEVSKAFDPYTMRNYVL